MTTHAKAFDRTDERRLAYADFRRSMRALNDAKVALSAALARLERADHPLGPITNETTAERLGFSPAQVAQLERQFCVGCDS